MTTAEIASMHEEVKALVPGLVTRYHAHHYLGFAHTQWRLFEKERRVKPLLYVYRVLLTGIHLVQSGEIEANLLKLNEHYRLPYVDDLVARKLAGPEKSALPDADVEFHRRINDILAASLPLVERVELTGGTVRRWRAQDEFVSELQESLARHR